MSKKEEIENIERLEMMEEKCGVCLDGIYAEFEVLTDDLFFIHVRGEVQSVNGTTLEGNLSVTMVAYNTKGKVIATHSEHFNEDDFFGLSPFQLSTTIIEKPVKIRIYPKNF